MKIITLLKPCLFAMALPLVACGGGEETKEDAPPTHTNTAAEEAPAAETAPATEEPAPAAAEAPAAAAVDASMYKGKARVTEATLSDGTSGLKVSSVKEGSGWAQCGIKSGDVLKSVSGTKVTIANMDSLYAACAAEGTAVIVERGGAEVKIR